MVPGRHLFEKLPVTQSEQGLKTRLPLKNIDPDFITIEGRD